MKIVQVSVGMIPVRLLSIDIAQALRLAIEFNLYAYDAYFPNCAKTLAHPFITLDDRIKQVANALKIQLLA